MDHPCCYLFQYMVLHDAAHVVGSSQEMVELIDFLNR